MLEYLLENSEYEREIAEGRVHHSEQENIMGEDGVKRRLIDSLGNYSENYLKSLDQHTDVLIEKEFQDNILKCWKKKKGTEAL